jgi:protein-tyrosine phosphatase
MKFSELPFGLNGKIYRSAMPFGNYDPEGLLIKRYQQAGIDTIVVLAEEAEILAQSGRNLSAVYEKLGLNVIHLPIEDFGIPSPEALRPVLEATVAEARAGKQVVIHCSAGIGRTGMFTACLAKKVLKLNGRGAIDWTRQHIPGAIETPEQVEFARNYAP